MITEKDLDFLEPRIQGASFHSWETEYPPIPIKDLVRLARLGLRFEQMQKDRAALLTWARQKKIPVMSMADGAILHPDGSITPQIPGS